MNDLLFEAGALVITAIVSLAIVFHFLRNKRQHKDFLLVVIFFSILFLIAIFGISVTLPDALNLSNGITKSKSGECEIVFLEDVGGRFGSSNYIHVSIDNIVVEANLEKFSHLEEGTYSCEIKYTEQSKTLIDVVVNKD